MKYIKKYLSLLFLIILGIFFVSSILDVTEKNYDTNFNTELIDKHINSLEELGPHSIVQKDSNEKAVNYITSVLDSYSLVNEDTIAKPAYQVQNFLTPANSYQRVYRKNVIAHIPANSERTDNVIMFMAHLDSISTGSGASDDSIACATMLEAIRYYLDKMNSGYLLNNDLVFVFTNGEEHGLLGATQFMNKFNKFNNLIERIKFGVNLESRGTSGTLIMFETSKNNYNTIKLFSEVNQNIFTSSVATFVYDMMPNGTDYSTFKDYYQGLNFANILGGEDYHTQNDSIENISNVYKTQEAVLLDRLIEHLSNYNLESLYDSNESAIFFSYLNITTVVYDNVFNIILAIMLLILLITNIVLSIVLNKEKNLIKTLKAILVTITGLVFSMLITLICYYLFQLLAALFNTIDIHMVGSITYSNIPIVIGIGFLVLSISSIVSYLGIKLFKIEARDLIRTQAYTHALLGIILSFVLKEASYLFSLSGILLLINEVLITIFKKNNLDNYHFELLVIGLYFPIIIPIIFLATSALGLTMSYVYALVFAVAIFDLGIYISQYLNNLSLIRFFKKNKKEYIYSLEGGCYILVSALIIFLIVSIIRPNANVNLLGKQGNSMLSYDDALIYVINEDEFEYRAYDLNAYPYLKKYLPSMEYKDGYYYSKANDFGINKPIKSEISNNILTINKYETSYVMLTFKNVDDNTNITVNSDGISTNYEIKDGFTLTLLNDSIILCNFGGCDVEYREYFIDYNELIPDGYDINEKLHFNLWLISKYKF